jgi:hypothetical protein
MNDAGYSFLSILIGAVGPRNPAGVDPVVQPRRTQASQTCSGNDGGIPAGALAPCTSRVLTVSFLQRSAASKLAIELCLRPPVNRMPSNWPVWLLALRQTSIQYREQQGGYMERLYGDGK